MLYQSGIQNAVATLGTATTPGHLKLMSNYANRLYVLFDPDAAGERAIERVVSNDSLTVTAANLQLDLRLLRLPQDPADWLLEHSPEEFTSMLDKAVPILEYSIRRIVDKYRGADAVSRSRAVPEMRDLVRKIDDSVLRYEAIRLATEALGVDSSALQERTHSRASTTNRAQKRSVRVDPHTEAGATVLSLILARPDLTAPLLGEGVQSRNLPAPLTLRTEDFRDETQARIFVLLGDHAGRDLDAVLSDERARPLMDHIGALASQGERLYPSETSVREAWLRLAILSRERSKRETQDYDEKDALQSEIQHLKLALRSSSAGA
jgi:DNA primase